MNYDTQFQKISKSLNSAIILLPLALPVNEMPHNDDAIENKYRYQKQE